MNATGAVRHFLLFLLGLACSPAFADDLQKARSAVNSFLVKDGGGLASSRGLCPPSVGNLQEYVTRIEFVPVSATTNALLLYSEMCGGGNKHGQYLYISKSSGGGDLITDAGHAHIRSMEVHAADMGRELRFRLETANNPVAVSVPTSQSSEHAAANEIHSIAVRRACSRCALQDDCA
jgi:hypothetical protein